MDEQRFWLVGNRGRVAVITDQARAARLTSDGAYGGVYRCDGPFVPESELRGAEDALREIAEAAEAQVEKLNPAINSAWVAGKARDALKARCRS